MADRYTYVPLIGIYVIAAWGALDLAGRWPGGKPILAALACVVLVACAVTTWIQISYWQNGRALYEHALRVTSGNYVAHNGLGMVYVSEGDLAEASEQFESSIRAKPDYAFALSNLGGVLGKQGNLKEAAIRFRQAIAAFPQFAEAHFNLGLILEHVGARAEAANEFERALRIQPGLAAARTHLEAIRNPAARRP
jgi:Tfp pilus assembly protein PilF